MDEEHVSPRLKELLASTLNSVEYTSPIQAVFDKYKCMPYAPGGPLAIKNLASAYILDTSIDDSFYVFDLGAVQRLYDAWQTAMPRVRPFYALKCSPMPAMIDLMKENGCGFDCASAAEIKMVLDAGVTQDRIIFAHPAKRPSDVRFAQKNGVKKTTFDSLVELEKIKKWHPDADCVLRIRADDPDAGISFGIKYGASPDEYEPLIRKCTELGLNLVGVSFHVGSLARSGMAFYEAIKQARVAFDCAKDLGFTMTFLDIGGGFTGRVNSSGVVQSMVGDIPANINESLEEFFGEACGYGEVAVIAEPGRYAHTHSWGYSLNLCSPCTHSQVLRRGVDALGVPRAQRAQQRGRGQQRDVRLPDQRRPVRLVQLRRVRRRQAARVAAAQPESAAARQRADPINRVRADVRLHGLRVQGRHAAAAEGGRLAAVPVLRRVHARGSHQLQRHHGGRARYHLHQQRNERGRGGQLGHVGLRDVPAA